MSARQICPICAPTVVLVFITRMSVTSEGSDQDATSIAMNAGFFDGNERYARLIASLDTYEEVRKVINCEIAGARRLLDIGNGGVFDYDTSLPELIVGVDLFLEDIPCEPDSGIVLRYGDALALAESDSTFDAVLVCSLFHHLVGRNADSTLANIRRAVGEAYRVLDPGGRLMVMESCVSAHAFAIERRLFGALRLLADTAVMKHPATLQFPPEMIADIIRERFGNVTVAPIPVGRWILQFGIRWPTRLTPARPYLFTATRH